MKSTGMKFADENIRARWVDGSIETVDRAVGRRMDLYEDGELKLSKLRFHITEGNEPYLERKDSRLLFSRLAWARYCDALGVNREFVRERLTSGDLGREYLTRLLNDLATMEKPWISRHLYLFHSGRKGEFVIREMMEDHKHGTLLSEDRLWNYLKGSAAWHPFSTPPQLVGVRLSDYGHAFRYLLRPASGPDGIALLMDICLSTIRKKFYAQALFAVQANGISVPLRLDHMEIGGKTNFTQIGSTPEAVRQSMDAALDFMPAFQGKVVGRERPEPGTHVLAAVIRCSRGRKLIRDATRMICKRMAQASWNRPLTVDVALESIVDAIAHDTDQPEIANRLERVAHDLIQGEYELKTNDRAEASRYLRGEKKLPAVPTRTWDAVHSESGTSS